MDQLIESTIHKLEIYVDDELFNTYEYEGTDRLGKRTRTLARRKNKRVVRLEKIYGNLEDNFILHRAYLADHTEESLRAKELQQQPKTELLRIAQEETGFELEGLTKSEIIALIVDTEFTVTQMEEFITSNGKVAS